MIVGEVAQHPVRALAVGLDGLLLRVRPGARALRHARVPENGVEEVDEELPLELGLLGPPKPAAVERGAPAFDRGDALATGVGPVEAFESRAQQARVEERSSLQWHALTSVG